MPLVKNLDRIQKSIKSVLLKKEIEIQKLSSDLERIGYDSCRLVDDDLSNLIFHLYGLEVNDVNTEWYFAKIRELLKKIDNYNNKDQIEKVVKEFELLLQSRALLE